jgi:hypothetical protein
MLIFNLVSKLDQRMGPYKTVTLNGKNASVNNPSRMEISTTTRVSVERHYSVAEIAAMWNLSKDVVRRLFCNEPGVLILDNRTRGSRRRYTTLRIPQSVLDRVCLRYTVG